MFTLDFAQLFYVTSSYVLPFFFAIYSQSHVKAFSLHLAISVVLQFSIDGAQQFAQLFT